MARYPLISFVIELSTLELTPLEELCHTLYQQTYPHFECLITLTPSLNANIDDNQDEALTAFLSAQSLKQFRQDPRFIFPTLPYREDRPKEDLPKKEAHALILSSQAPYKASSPFFPFLSDILGSYFAYLPLSVRLPPSFLTTVVSDLTLSAPHLFTSHFFSQQGHNYPTVPPNPQPQSYPNPHDNPIQDDSNHSTTPYSYLAHYLHHLPYNIPHPPLTFIKSHPFLTVWHKTAQKFTTQCRSLTYPTPLLSSAQLFQLYLLQYSQREEITFCYKKEPLYRRLENNSPPDLYVLTQEFLKISTVKRTLSQPYKTCYSPLIHTYLEDLSVTLITRSWQKNYIKEPTTPHYPKALKKELAEELMKRLTKKSCLPTLSLKIKWWLLKRDASFVIRLIRSLFPKF